MTREPRRTTLLLHRLRGGDRSASEELLALVYGELHRLAAGYMRNERRDHTLQPTALINEVWIKLFGPGTEGPPVSWEDRAHFLGIAAKAMRDVLIDHSKKVRAAKRGGDWNREELRSEDALEVKPVLEFLALHEAIDRLREVDENTSRVAELRLFGGLTHNEIATVLGIPLRSVERIWRTAKACLRADLGSGDEHVE